MIGAAALGAADDVDAPSNTVNYGSTIDQAEYEEFFRASFRSAAIATCLAEIPSETSAEFDFEPSCSCLADALLANRSIEELEKASGPDKDIDAFAAQCLKSDPPVAKTK